MPAFDLASIRTLDRLNELRCEVRKMRREAFAAIVKHGRDYLKADSSEALRDVFAFDMAGDDVERALTTSALNIYLQQRFYDQEETDKSRKEKRESAATLHRGLLEKLARSDCLVDPDKILGCFGVARVLYALANTPGMAFCKLALRCYWYIVDELNNPGAPELHNRTGGAAACGGGPDSAFVTAECTRAVAALARRTRRTADLAGAMKTLVKRNQIIKDNSKFLPQAWTEAEQRRLAVSALVLLSKYWRKTLLYLDNDEQLKKIRDAVESATTCQEFTQRPSDKLPSIDDLAKTLRKNTKAQIALAKTARMTAEDCYKSPNSSPTPASSAIREKFKEYITALEGINDNCEDEKFWKEIETKLREIERLFWNRLIPTQSYLESVLHRELLADGTEGHACDAIELACAASGYGYLTQEKGKWQDELLERAFKVVTHHMTRAGRIAKIRPVLANKKGYEVHAVVPETTLCLANFIRHNANCGDVDVIEKMVRYYRDTKKDDGWTLPDSPQAKPSWWMTALTAIALDRFTKALDRCVNTKVFEHFDVVTPERLELDLDKIMYPDYGLSTRRHSEYRSVALLLQSLRAHLAGNSNAHCSAVFFGPPGTGKTTAAEALASTAHRPFLEVTPSDLLEGGLEHLEERARQVFRMLTYLTDTVILMDEFDPLIRDRNRKDQPPGILPFLTPGMLPKLHHLHEAAKRNRVVFILATNRVEEIDAAAIRAGRFDVRIGLYPPDAVSRAGHLACRLAEEGGVLGAVDQSCMVTSVAETAQGTMARVARSLGALDGGHWRWIINEDGTKPEKEQPEQSFKRRFRKRPPESCGTMLLEDDLETIEPHIHQESPTPRYGGSVPSRRRLSVAAVRPRKEWAQRRATAVSEAACCHAELRSPPELARQIQEQSERR
jgi:hypothetical protein